MSSAVVVVSYHYPTWWWYEEKLECVKCRDENIIKFVENYKSIYLQYMIVSYYQKYLIIHA